jgi:hypothetical protein
MTKPPRSVIVLGVIAAVLVVLFFAGVGFGSARSGGLDVTAAVNRLKNFDAAQSVPPDKLAVSGSCSLDPGTGVLQVSGGCVLGVPAVGALSLRGSRKLLLGARQVPLTFDTTVEGLAVHGQIAAHDAKKLTFGRSAASVTVTCVGAPTCLADLG